MNDLNILILSCGTRNKIVQYFKQELGSQGLVFATDCNKLAPALYDADRFFIVPNINDQEYLDSILHICMENKIKAVFIADRSGTRFTCKKQAGVFGYWCPAGCFGRRSSGNLPGQVFHVQISDWQRLQNCKELYQQN